jgi:hypothetical protein
MGQKPGFTQTAPCRAPYFYEEENWVDDMELAAQLDRRFPGTGFTGPKPSNTAMPNRLRPGWAATRPGITSGIRSSTWALFLAHSGSSDSADFPGTCAAGSTVCFNAAKTILSVRRAVYLVLQQPKRGRPTPRRGCTGRSGDSSYGWKWNMRCATGFSAATPGASMIMRPSCRARRLAPRPAFGVYPPVPLPYRRRPRGRPHLRQHLEQTHRHYPVRTGRIRRISVAAGRLPRRLRRLFLQRADHGRNGQSELYAGGAAGRRTQPDVAGSR